MKQKQLCIFSAHPNYTSVTFCPLCHNAARCIIAIINSSGISAGGKLVCWYCTHRRSVAKRGGRFQRRLFVCQFVCPHDNF